MAHGGMQAVLMAMLCMVYGIMAVAAMSGGRSQQRFVGLFFVIVIAIIAIFTALFAGSQIIGGYKLFKEKANARTWGIIGSVLSCLSFPLGTAAGVYGLWFLSGDQGKQMYLNPALPQSMFGQPKFENQPAPPPNSWQ